MSERVDITTLATIEKIDLIVIGLLDHNRHNFQNSNNRQSGHADPFKNQPLALIHTQTVLQTTLVYGAHSRTDHQSTQESTHYAQFTCSCAVIRQKRTLVVLPSQLIQFAIIANIYPSQPIPSRLFPSACHGPFVLHPDSNLTGVVLQYPNLSLSPPTTSTNVGVGI